MRIVSTVLLVGMSLTGSGCGTAMYSVWPRATEHETVVEAHEVNVRSTPEGPEVQGEDGEVLGTTPFTYRTERAVEYRWRGRRDKIGAGVLATLGFLGTVVGGTVLGLRQGLLQRDGEHQRYRPLALLGLVFVSMWDMTGIPSVAGLTRARADRARADAEPDSRPGLARLTLRWPGGGPSVVLEVDPTVDRHVLAQLPPVEGFDASLALWDARRPPSAVTDPDMAYELARVHHERAATGLGPVEAAREAGLAFLALAAEDDPRRAEVHAWVAALHGAEAP